MSVTLRSYQTQIIEKARSHMKQGHRSILIQSPTGSGKTLLTAHMLGTSAAKGMGSWFIVHRRELVKQSVRTFANVGVRHGVIAASFPDDPRPLTQIASIQTLANRFHKVKKPKLIIWDECHHIAAGSWSKIFSAFHDSFHIGLTATPERLDGKGLGDYFKHMINGPPVNWLIENKFLAPYRLFCPGNVNLQGVHTKMGDFVKSELSTLMDKPTITGDAIKHYSKYAHGKRAVVFCVSIEHSKHVVEQFLAAGIPAAHVDGETDSLERDQAIKDFESGRTLVLSNVELFGEGFDLPAIEVAILLRPTQSLGMYLQQVGRVLRPSPGKENAIILDHVGNAERHGLPDQDREWSLAGREARRKKDSAGPSVRVCPVCFAAQFSGKPVCGYCNHVFALNPRVVEQVDGELVELNPEMIREMKVLAQRQRVVEQSKAQSLEDLIEIGRNRGYKRPELWARHVYRARNVKKIRGF